MSRAKNDILATEFAQASFSGLRIKLSSVGTIFKRHSSREKFRSATVWSRMSSAVADSGTVQANTSLAMAPKPRLFFLSTRALIGRAPARSAEKCKTHLSTTEAKGYRPRSNGTVQAGRRRAGAGQQRRDAVRPASTSTLNGYFFWLLAPLPASSDGDNPSLLRADSSINSISHFSKKSDALAACRSFFKSIFRYAHFGCSIEASSPQSDSLASCTQEKKTISFFEKRTDATPTMYERC